MWWRRRRGASRFRRHVLDSVELGFVDVFWIPAGKDVYVAEVETLCRHRHLGQVAAVYNVSLFLPLS